MEYKKFENTYFLRIDKGEEVLKSITNLCKEEKVTCGSIRGIGAANNVTIGRFEAKTKEYKSLVLTGDLEILSLSGNITSMQNEPYIHIHAVLCGNNFNCVGGHLNRAVISTTCEVVIRSAHGFVDRQFSDEIGLFLLKF